MKYLVVYCLHHVLLEDDLATTSLKQLALCRYLSALFDHLSCTDFYDDGTDVSFDHTPYLITPSALGVENIETTEPVMNIFVTPVGYALPLLLSSLPEKPADFLDDDAWTTKTVTKASFIYSFGKLLVFFNSKLAEKAEDEPEAFTNFTQRLTRFSETCQVCLLPLTPRNPSSSGSASTPS